MKILLLGEYSNVHHTLGEGLKALGHQVTVASNGDFWKDYPRDVDMSRTYTKWGGIRLLSRFYMHLNRFEGYDIVQLINPMFLELKAERLFAIYRFLRKHNRKVILCGFGMDYYWVHTCVHQRHLKYSDFNIGDRLRDTADARKEIRDWTDSPKERLNVMIADDCDGIITGLYEYWTCYHPVFPDKTVYIPFPIHSSQDTKERDTSGKTRIFIGINRERNEYKGTDIMLSAAEDIIRKYPDRAELVKAESVPFDEYQHLMDGCDLILDQLYSYTPSMNSLLAMSKGIIDVGGGEEEQYELIGEKTLRPIINVQPHRESVYQELEQIVLHPERIAPLKRQSKEYVSKYHDYIQVSRQYEDFYRSLLK